MDDPSEPKWVTGICPCLGRVGECRGLDVRFTHNNCIPHFPEPAVVFGNKTVKRNILFMSDQFFMSYQIFCGGFKIHLLKHFRSVVYAVR